MDRAEKMVPKDFLEKRVTKEKVETWVLRVK